MLETYSFNSDGTADTLNFPGMADNATYTPGLVYTITGCTTNDKESFRIDKGNIIIPHASSGKPGLFTGLQDQDGALYPGRIVGGTIQENVILPVYAKRVKDINNKYWQLSELADKGSWQAATLAKCVIQPATDTTEEKAIYLKLHTERGGDTLVFELTTDICYSGV